MDVELMVRIANCFESLFNEFNSAGIINIADLGRHSKSNIHSWLQYLMMRSGEQNGLLAIPEVKLRFTRPIIPGDFGLRLKSRRRGHSRVDIAFYDDKKNLRGISEIETMDQAHGALRSKCLATEKNEWLTPRDSILHLAQFTDPKPNFILMVIILCEKAPYQYWKTGIKEIDEEIETTKNYYKVFEPHWEKLHLELVKLGILNTFLIINEEGVKPIKSK